MNKYILYFMAALIVTNCYNENNERACKDHVKNMIINYSLLLRTGNLKSKDSQDLENFIKILILNEYKKCDFDPNLIKI